MKRWFIASIRLIYGDATPAFLTILPTDPVLQPTELDQLDIDAHRQNLGELWEAAGLYQIPFIAGLDLSWNKYSGIIEDHFWCVHWHGFIPAECGKEIERRLGFLVPKTLAIHKPVRAKPIVRTSEKVFSYAFKTEFETRKQIVYSPTRREESSGKRITPGHSLLTTLALGLDRVGLQARIMKLGQAPAN